MAKSKRPTTKEIAKPSNEQLTPEETAQLLGIVSSPEVSETPNTEMPTAEETITVTKAEIKPMATVSASIASSVEKVKLVNSYTGKIIAMSVERKLAERMVASNTKLKIG
jgi:hypothetical protein